MPNQEARYIAYGDDSQFENILVYAFILIKKEKIENACKRLLELKRIYQIPDEHILHCRTLFSGQQRMKHGLQHLSQDNIQNVIKRVVKIVNETPMLLRYAYCNLSEAQKDFPNENGKLTLYNKDFSKTMQIPANPTSKGLLGLLAQACFAINQDGLQGPLLTECEIVISEDKTKTYFMGEKQRQAHNWCSGFQETHKKVVKLNPIIKASNQEPMLQIADIMSYICSHALSSSKEQNTIFFKRQLERIKYWTRSVFVP